MDGVHKFRQIHFNHNTCESQDVCWMIIGGGFSVHRLYKGNMQKNHRA